MKLTEIKNKITSIWNHTEIEMDDLSRAGIRKHVMKISDIVNELITDMEELKKEIKTCTVCSYEVCDACMDGMNEQYCE